MPRMMVKKRLFFTRALTWPENFEKYIPNRFVSFFISGKNSITTESSWLFVGKKYIQGDYFEGWHFCDIFGQEQILKLTASH